MFYSSDLLVFKRGKFSLIWLAATRGEKFLSKKDLKMVDIQFACTEVMEYIMLQQQMKLSLYLSSQLTFGLCVIYHKKIEKLLNELQDLYRKSFIISTNSSVNTKEKKKVNKQQFSLNSVLDEFDTSNISFGMLNHLDFNLANQLNEMDLTNQVAYLNQARFEDITLMECDLGAGNLRNQLENDLEPMNVEMLQELLGVPNPNKNELETFLNKPFNTSVEIQDDYNHGLKSDDHVWNVDLDKENSLIVNNINLETHIQVKDNLDENNFPFIEAQVLETNDFGSHVKASCAIQIVEVDQGLNKNVLSVNINDTNIRPQFRNRKVRKPLKRRIAIKPLIIDTVTTTSYQFIRENMNKNGVGLVDKNSLFPNPFIIKSSKSQIACSVNNLFEFPGSYVTLRSSKLLRLWMNRKDICKKVKSPFAEYDYLPSTEELHKNNQDYSDMSIEKFREASSSNMNIPIDSFTFGSDTLQRSIRQSSFDADKTLDENNQFVPEVSDVHNNYSLEVSMMPIIEEDLNQKQVFCKNNVEHIENKIDSKRDVWKVIQNLLQNEFEKNKAWDEARVRFTDICPIHSSKKMAAMVFLTILRLGKYKKIRIFQEDSISEVFIGLPSKEI